MVRSLLAALGLLSLIAISAVSVQAYNDFSDEDEVVRLRVPTTGLDLTTRDGVALLDARIDRAVRKLCDYNSGSSVLGTYSLERKCRTNAYASTRRQVALAIDDAWRARRYAMSQRRYGPRYAYAPSRAPMPAYARDPGFICRDGNARRVPCGTAITGSTYDGPAYGEPRYAAPAPYHAPVRYREPIQYAEAPPHPASAWGGPPRGRPDLPPVYHSDPRLGDLDADLSHQPSGVRGAVQRAMVLAFQRGDAAQWRSWGTRGYVTVSEPRRHRGTECRNVAVVRAVLGGYDTIAAGLQCWTRDDGFTADWN